MLRTTVPLEPSSWSVSSGRAAPSTHTSTRSGLGSTLAMSKFQAQPYVAVALGNSVSLRHSLPMPHDRPGLPGQLVYEKYISAHLHFTENPGKSRKQGRLIFLLCISPNEASWG